MRYLRKITLAQLPTPLHGMPSFRRALDFSGSIYIKRDDLTGLAAGGNKSRKLEYLTGDAVEKGADTLITAGGLQSNHCLQTAAAARKLGFDCHLVLGEKKPGKINGNLFLDLLAGASVHYTDRAGREKKMQELAESLRAEGRHPYVIPVGGSNATGTVGYVMAMDELQRQLALTGIPCDRIIVASSSGGTLAGMTLGAKYCGFKGKITGISIDREKTGKHAFPPELAALANRTAELLELDIRLAPGDFDLEYGYLGKGYGVVGENERKAIMMLPQTEGIFVGPVYTGRALGAMIDCIRKGKWRDENLLFWHTGDTAALFAYTGEL
ncbi:MAG: D-cysteine desulfhydrase family protein [Candidatus Marinimicrobia bacterium]|nr:D-cysteine desulfhydrase family protein [Candidatus Neomarinimicrobiota bacterium]